MALNQDQLRQARKFGSAPTQQETAPSDGGVLRTVADTGIDLAQGVMRLPGVATGVADTATGLLLNRRVLGDITERVGEGTGFRPGQWADNLEQYHSQAQQAQRANVDAAFEGTSEAAVEGRYGEAFTGAMRGMRELATNPRALASTVFESLPSMIAGGVIGRGLRGVAGTTTAPPRISALQSATGAAVPTGQAVATGAASRQAAQAAGTLTQAPRMSAVAAGALGEATVITGTIMDEIDRDIDPARAALAALGAGVGGAAFSYAGGRAAVRMGALDPETAIAGGFQAGARDLTRRSMPSRVARGALAEGVLQELPQETLQTISVNWAEGEPLLKDVPRAAIEGMMAGGVLGGMTNVYAPRRADQPSNLVRTPPVLEDEAPAQRTMEVQGAELNDLLRYHRRLTRVAQEATQHPDLQEQALGRIQGVMAELERQGVPREVVDLELSKSRYTELQLEEEQMQRRYREAVVSDPQRALTYLERARQRRSEIEALESTYGEEALISPNLAIIRELQTVPEAEGYFRTSRGEPTNRLKGRVVQKLEDFRALDDDALARRIADDIENASNGLEPDRWAPLRRVVAQERGLTEEFVFQMSDRVQAETIAQDDPTARPDVTDAAQIRTPEDFEQATARFDDDPAGEGAAPVDAVSRAMEFLNSGLTPAQQRTWDALKAAVSQAEAGSSSRSVISRAAQIAGVTRQALERSFRRIITGAGQAAGSSQIRTMSPQRFMDTLLAGTVVQTEAVIPEAAVDPSVMAEESFGQETGDPNVEILGAGGGAVIGSAGGSQTNIDATFDGNATRIAELRERLQGESDPDARAQVEAQIQTLQAQNELYRQQEQALEQALKLPAQQEQAEADRIAAENEQAAAQRREELRQQAEAALASSEAQAMAQAWDKRASRLWPEGSTPVMWAELVQSSPETAVAWVAWGVEMLSTTPQSQWRDQLRSMFTDFATEISNDQAQTQSGQQDAGTADAAGPEPATPASSEAELAAEATRDRSAQVGESGPVTASAAPGPTVTVRRGRRVQPMRLQPAQAATAEAIDAAIDAAIEPNAGPEVLEQAMTQVVQDRARYDEARGVRPVQAQIDVMSDTLALLRSGYATLDSVLDSVAQLAGDNDAYMSLAESLRNHPSLSNVRFLPDNRYSDNTSALGLYFPTLHAVYVNETHYLGSIVDMQMGIEPASSRQDHALAETILHELLHAASYRYIAQNPNDASVAELNSIREEVTAYLQENMEDFTIAELSAVQNMLADNSEFVTYSLTSPYVQSALSRIPSSSAPQPQGIFGRVVRTIMNMLGLNPRFESVLARLMQVSGNIVNRDALYTRNAMAELNQFTDQEALSVIQQYNQMVARVRERYDMSSYSQELSEAIDSAFAARESGDDAARRAQHERVQRIMDAVREIHDTALLNGELRQDGVQALMQRPVGTTTLLEQVQDRALQRAPATLRNALVDLKNRIKRVGYLSMFSSDFVDSVKRHLPQVETYFNTIFHRLSERNNMHVELQKIVEPVGDWNTAKREKLNTFLRDSTYAERWGFQPEWIAEPVEIDRALARQFDAMDPDAQRVAKQMFRHASAMNQEMQALLRQDIARTYDEYIEKARREPEKVRRRQEKERALRDHDERQINFKTAYLPLKRWGEWVVAHKSDRFKQAEAARNTSEVRRLKADPAHYRVMFADSEFQARQLRDELSSELGVPVEDPIPRMRMEENNEIIPFDVMQRLKAEVASGDDGTSKAISSAIDKLYIEALAESSVRKSELQRLKVEGASRDMVRAFIEHGQGLAALGSALKINRETRRVLAEMKKHARDPRAGRDRGQRMMALNEVLARHAQALEFNPDTTQQKIMAGTSVWMLLTSPAYYIQNSTQPFMLTYPVLAARFGAVKSMGYMRAAYADVFNAQRRSRNGELLDPMKLTDPEEQALFERLQRRNLLDVGIAADLGSLAEAQSTLGKVASRAHRKMVHAVRMVEVYNRGVTALASYRLRKQQLEADRDSGRNQLTDSAIVEEAKRYTMKVVQTTQGDYSGPNAPRLISMIPMGRLVTQFRKFQLIQIGLLARTVNQSFRGATAAERTIGRKQLGYILTMHGMVGGAMGLPAANIIGYALAKAFGDQDEPADAELLARRAIGNKDIADLILKGLPAALGVDASARLGMGLTFSIMPFADVSASRDGMHTLLANLLGPTAGLAVQAGDGIGQIQQGNVAMGMSQMMPSILRNSIRSYMYLTDGIRLRNGDLAMRPEELSWFDVGSQGLGWPSKRITDRYMAQGALIGVQQHFRGRTTQIKRAYVEAFDAGDHSGMSSARSEWLRLQAMRREYGVGQPQSMGQLTRAPRERSERERSFVEGVPTQRTTRRFVESLFE